MSDCARCRPAADRALVAHLASLHQRLDDATTDLAQARQVAGRLRAENTRLRAALTHKIRHTQETRP